MQFLCLGTHFGKIYLFDHQGNIVTLNSNSKDLPIMPLPINQINIDEKGEFIAACSGEHVCTHIFSYFNLQYELVNINVFSIVGYCHWFILFRRQCQFAFKYLHSLCFFRSNLS